VRYCRVYGLGVSLLSFTGSVTAINNRFYKIGSISTDYFLRTATITALYYPLALDRGYMMSTQSGIFSIS
jgi:hypothetical protein